MPVQTPSPNSLALSVYVEKQWWHRFLSYLEKAVGDETGGCSGAELWRRRILSDRQQQPETKGMTAVWALKWSKEWGWSKERRRAWKWPVRIKQAKFRSHFKIYVFSTYFTAHTKEVVLNPQTCACVFNLAASLHSCSPLATAPYDAMQPYCEACVLGQVFWSGPSADFV